MPTEALSKFAQSDAYVAERMRGAKTIPDSAMPAPRSSTRFRKLGYSV